MNTHRITKGDTGTPLAFVLGDRLGPWDLTGATVKFRYSVAGVVTEKSCSPDLDQTANKGKASSTWGSSELAPVPAGSYLCQAKVTFPSSGQVRYAPEAGTFNTLEVRDPL